MPTVAAPAPIVAQELQPTAEVAVAVPYDENLLERARTQWQFGDWQSLAGMGRDSLQHHPDRAKLALLAAAGHQQSGDVAATRQWVRLAKNWGCSDLLVSQVLISGVYNTLARASASTGEAQRAQKHFQSSIAVGMPGTDLALVGKARRSREYARIDWVVSTETAAESNILHSKGSQTSAPKFSDIYRNRKIGKVSDKWTSYLEIYDRILRKYQRATCSILEVGVQNGGALEIYAEYFQRAKIIVGCDVNPNCAKLQYGDSRIRLVVGDATAAETIEKIVAIEPSFDIIIDDASHQSADIIKTFVYLYPKLKHDGIYVIEDLHAGYWKEYGGGLQERKSAIRFMYALADICNFEHWGLNISRFDYVKDFNIVDNSLTIEDELATIKSVHFYNSVCVVHKSRSLDKDLGLRSISGSVADIFDVRHLHATRAVTPPQE